MLLMIKEKLGQTWLALDHGSGEQQKLSGFVLMFSKLWIMRRKKHTQYHAIIVYKAKTDRIT